MSARVYVCPTCGDTSCVWAMYRGEWVPCPVCTDETGYPILDDEKRQARVRAAMAAQVLSDSIAAANAALKEPKP